MVPDGIPFFPRSEFQFPDQVNEEAVRYLSAIRVAFGEALIVTDDARPAGVLPPGGSKASWHYKGQAFDLRIRHWAWEQLWRFVRAVVTVQAQILPARAGVELEIVWSDRDKHAHIAFTLDARPCRFIVQAD